jgi:phosphohistidine phosphatase
MRLYLVQHGEALAKEVDAERPLSPEGTADVGRLAAFLRGYAEPVHIQHSGKTRARQTAEILAAALGGEVAAVDGIAPNDPVAAWAAGLDGLAGDTVVVGHLPFVARAVSWLLLGREESLVAYQPGSMVCLERSEEGWTLAWMLRPELLA